MSETLLQTKEQVKTQLGGPTEHVDYDIDMLGSDRGNPEVEKDSALGRERITRSAGHGSVAEALNSTEE